MNTEDYEIFRHYEYRPFLNSGRLFHLSSEPYLDIVFNDHCNAKCKFCISKLVHKKIKADIEELKPKILYAVEKMGVREVLLLGGEPTINDDIFPIIDYLKQFNLNKICITTNGYRLSKDVDYRNRLFSSGITHLNLSLMNIDKHQQLYISGSKTYVGLSELRNIYTTAHEYGVLLRINNNVFVNNHDSVSEMLGFYNNVKHLCDSVKFSPLLKTDSFGTVNKVTEFNRQHTLSDEEYDALWHGVESWFANFPIVKNHLTFGFVPYSMIMLPTPIILNYNQHGKLREKVVNEMKINNLKLLATGELSLSWNREEKDWIINTIGE